MRHEEHQPAPKFLNPASRIDLIVFGPGKHYTHRVGFQGVMLPLLASFACCIAAAQRAVPKNPPRIFFSVCYSSPKSQHFKEEINE